jgi:nucleotide-binding universal stress UspA family protein
MISGPSHLSPARRPACTRGSDVDEEVPTMSATYRVVAGVDGSEGGRRALRWAIRDAAARGGTVEAVIAWRLDLYDLPPYGSVHPDDERRRCEQVLAHEIESIPVFERAEVPVAAIVAEGRAPDVLSAAARSADLLVLGSHGHGRMRHTVLGSVSEECVRKATCPVVVIPIDQDSRAEPAEPAVRNLIAVC